MATGVAAAVSMVTLLVGVSESLLLPRTNWIRSWEHPLKAVAAGMTAVLATIGAVLIAVRSWKGNAPRSARLVSGSLLMVVVTVVSVLVLVRSGTWLSDMQFELH